MKKNYIYYFIIKNTPQKLLAVLFAFLVWYIATVPLKYNAKEIYLSVAITYSEVPENFVITSELPQTANVTALVKNTKNINPVDFLIIVDLASIQSGINRINLLTDAEFNAPDKADILNVDPLYIDIQAEETIEKMIPLKANIEGKVAEGFVMETVELFPKVVQVKGPKSKITSIKHILTDTIEVGNESQDFTRVTTPIFPLNFRLVNKADSTVEVKIKLTKESLSRRYSNIPVKVVGNSYVTKINPRTVNLLLKGPVDVINNLTIENIAAFANVEGMSPGNHKLLQPEVNLPDVVMVEKSWPPIDIWILNQKLN